MKFNELQTSRKQAKTRSGRGISAGRGKTAGRGTKGQNARKSGGVRPGFEGGQTPMMQKVPKLRGFRSLKPKTYEVYTSQLQEFTGTIDNKKLAEAEIVPSEFVIVKVIQNGELSKKVTVKLQAATKGAIKQIEKASGSFEAVERVKQAKAKSKKDDK